MGDVGYAKMYNNLLIQWGYIINLIEQPVTYDLIATLNISYSNTNYIVLSTALRGPDFILSMMSYSNLQFIGDIRRINDVIRVHDGFYYISIGFL